MTTKEPMECQVHDCHNIAIYRVWEQPELFLLSRRYVCADHLYFAVKDYRNAIVTLDADIHEIVDFKAVLAAQGIIVHPTYAELVAWFNKQVFEGIRKEFEYYRLAMSREAMILIWIDACKKARTEFGFKAYLVCLSLAVRGYLSYAWFELRTRAR